MELDEELELDELEDKEELDLLELEFDELELELELEDEELELDLELELELEELELELELDKELELELDLELEEDEEDDFSVYEFIVASNVHVFVPVVSILASTESLKTSFSAHVGLNDITSFLIPVEVYSALYPLLSCTSQLEFIRCNLQRIVPSSKAFILTFTV